MEPNELPRTHDEDEAQRQQQGRREGARKHARAAHREEKDDDEADKLAKLRDVGRNLSEQLEVQMRERPYVVLGAAAGVGFALGAMVGSRLGQIALAAGVGYVGKNLLRGVAAEEVQKLVKRGIDRLTQDRDDD